MTSMTITYAPPQGDNATEGVATGSDGGDRHPARKQGSKPLAELPDDPESRCADLDVVRQERTPDQDLMAAVILLAALPELSTR